VPENLRHSAANLVGAPAWFEIIARSKSQPKIDSPRIDRLQGFKLFRDD